MPAVGRGHSQGPLRPPRHAARSGPVCSACSREQQGNQCHLLGAATSEVAGAAAGSWAPPAALGAALLLQGRIWLAARAAAACCEHHGHPEGCQRAPGTCGPSAGLLPHGSPAWPCVLAGQRAWPHVQAPASARSCSSARPTPASSRGRPCPFAGCSLGKGKPVTARSVPAAEAEPCLEVGTWQAAARPPAQHHHSRSPRTPLHRAVLVPTPCHPMPCQEGSVVVLSLP